MDDIDFLSLDDVLIAHLDQIGRYGGDPGVRDLGLLESAMTQPQATFGGQQLHAFPFEMAAAYLFHIVQNLRSSMGTSARAPWRHCCFST